MGQDVTVVEEYLFWVDGGVSALSDTLNVNLWANLETIWQSS